MLRVLLTGMSGTGKSAIVRELAERGYRALDADAGYVVPMPDGTQRWDETAVAALLDDDEGPALFFAGCEENMVAFLGRFDRVILLSAPVATIEQRLDGRANPFGKESSERRKILADVETIEPRLGEIADDVIDTTPPLDEVVATVLRLVGLPAQGPQR